jgi:fucose permease
MRRREKAKIRVIIRGHPEPLNAFQKLRRKTLATPEARPIAAHSLLLMLVSFLGIYLYGLLTALPGSVLPTIERNQYLPNDTQVGNFLLINAVGSVLAYVISGPLIDKVGKKVALLSGTLVVIVSMIAFALTVTKIGPAAALLPLFACGLLLGLGANAIVSAGHALVAEVASVWRNAALNVLDIFFGLGLMTLPIFAQGLMKSGGLSLVFWVLAIAGVILALFVVMLRFPKPAHPESFTLSEAGELFKNSSFWLIAIALFMYVGTEVSVIKWVVSFMERDAELLSHSGLVNTQTVTHATPAALTAFFENDPIGIGIATFAQRTLSSFALALLVGRIVSSVLLGILKVNSRRLLVVGSAVTAIGLGLAFTATSPERVRWALVLSGIGMGPIFPTSVGLASVMVTRIAGTAMSLAMGIGFAGLLVIPPVVGYVSVLVGGAAGNVRTGLLVVLTAAIVMFLLHLVLMLRTKQ